MFTFVKHVLKVALGVGLVTGLFLFSLLLYVSDFGSSVSPPEADVEQSVAGEEAALAPNADISFNQRFLVWVFGPPAPEGQEEAP
jgi:hypothetical protein